MFTKIATKMKSAERALGASLGADISTTKGRRRALWHFYLLDHGILRTFWTNLFEITPGVWRSNQPSPRRLRKYKKMGIKTVLNLRGQGKRSPYLFERETCDDVDLPLIDFPMQARHLDNPKRLLMLLEHFENIEHPFVMHCKSGADRAGLASALYLLHIKGASIDEAKRQLGFKYVHVKSFQTGILDHMLEAYETDTKTKPMLIREWIETRYDAAKLAAEFDTKRATT